MFFFFYKICTETFSSLFSAAIERLFSRIFKTNIQIDGFYSLLKTEASSNIEVQIKLTNPIPAQFDPPFQNPMFDVQI